MRFYLGTHMPHWLARMDVPLFVSHRRLAGRKTLPEATSGWALDSGGFTELSMFGEWRTTVAHYVAAVRRYAEEIGHLDWAAPMDWMCEPVMLAKTKLGVVDHQRRTVENFLQLRDLAPELPFIPVLQGWTLEDYLRCVDRYAAAGVDLAAYPTVGLGTVCRRQGTTEITSLVGVLAELGLNLHGFGVKTAGVRQYGPDLLSADSMAWSYGGRREPGCEPGHRNEANCPRYALAWRDRLLAAAAEGGHQFTLPVISSQF